MTIFYELKESEVFKITNLIVQAKSLESYSIYDFVFKGFKSNPERVVDTIMRTEINIYLSQCVATSNLAYDIRCR